MTALPAAKRGAQPAPIAIRSLTVVSIDGVRNHATIVAVIDGVQRVFESTGTCNGPIDAICHALEPLVGKFSCKAWSGKGETEGSDAVGRIDVTLCQEDRIFHGTGHDSNTLVASAKAIADAFDKHRYCEWHSGK